MRVFISYASQDRDFVENLVTTLREKNIAVFDAHEGIEAGRPITLAIEDAIRESDAILLIVSKASSQSKWVSSEWAMAIAEREKIGKRIFPIRLDPDVEMPFFLKDIAWLNIGDRLHPEPDVRRLLDALQRSGAPELPERKRKAEQNRISAERLLLDQETILLTREQERRTRNHFYTLSIFGCFGLLVSLLILLSLLPDASGSKLGMSISFLAGASGAFLIGWFSIRERMKRLTKAEQERIRFLEQKFGESRQSPSQQR